MVLSKHPAALDGLAFFGGHPPLMQPENVVAGPLSPAFPWGMVNCCATGRVMGLIVGKYTCIYAVYVYLYLQCT